MYCRECGSLIEEGELFCGNCGAPVAGADPAKMQENVSGGQGNRSGAGNATDGQNSTVPKSPVSSRNTAPGSPKKKHSLRVPLAAGAALVLAAALGVGGFFLFRSIGEDGKGPGRDRGKSAENADEVRWQDASPLYAILEAGTGISVVEGYVTDITGEAVAGVTVDLLGDAEKVKTMLRKAGGENGESDGEEDSEAAESSDGGGTGSGTAGSLTEATLGDEVLLYRGVTDENGYFRIYVYLDGAECRLVVRGEAPYEENSLYGIQLTPAEGGYACGNLVLHCLDGDEYPVHMDIFAAMDVVRGEAGLEGDTSNGSLPGAAVSIRAGKGAREGEVLRSLTAGGNGSLDLTLPAGTYTAQIQAEGYADSYVTVEVAEQAVSVSGYLLPAVPEGQTGVVLTWEGETDLDLILFTPWQGADGDMTRIGGSTARDSHGNRLVRDNTGGCEVMYVNTSEQGSYKLYVNDYTDSETGNYGANAMEGLDIHVYFYDSTGLIGEYIFPQGESGVVWEVADLTGGRPTPGKRVYASPEGKSWWTGSKWELNLEECPALTGLMWDMAVTAESYEEREIDVSVAQGWYSGNWENLSSLVANVVFHNNDIELERYSQNNIEDVTERFLGEGYGVGYCLRVTEEQIEYLAYAATGIHWDLESLDQMLHAHAAYVTDSGVQLDGDGIVFTSDAGGGVDWTDLKDMTSEYAGAGQWQVKAECMHGSDYDPTVKLADITFTVIRNPDSCFDGYSITGVEVTPTDNSGWASAYYDYISNVLSERYTQGFTAFLCNIDDDGIPEIIWDSGVGAEGSGLWHYNNGCVLDENIAGYGSISYIPGSGLVMGGGGRQGEYYNGVYRLENGELITLFEVYYTIKDEFYGEETWEDWMFDYDMNGEMVTVEEYMALLNENFDQSAAISFYNSERDSLDYILVELQDYINN